MQANGPNYFKSKKWDLLLMTLNYQDQVIDLSGAYDTKIFNEKTGSWQAISDDLSKAWPQNIFGLLNTELTLPIKYSQPRFEISAAAHLAIPHSLSASDIVSDAFIYYTLSVNYFIFVDSNFKNKKKEKKR